MTGFSYQPTKIVLRRPIKSAQDANLYAGLMISNVYGGFANGYQANQNLAPTAGLRVKF